MREWIELGSAPTEEEPAQLGSPDYERLAEMECKAYRNQLLRLHSKAPSGIRFQIRRFAHDFGAYSEVVVYYDSTDSYQLDFAFHIEAHLPTNWDIQALDELSTAKHPSYSKCCPT